MGGESGLRVLRWLVKKIAEKLQQHVSYKVITGMVLLLLLFSFILTNIGYNTFSEALFEQYADGAFMTAETATHEVKAYRIPAFAESGGQTKEYETVLKRLDDLCNSSGSTFIYVIQPDRSDYAHITFLFSTMNHDSSYTLYDFGYVRETTNDEYKRKYRRLYEKESDRELVIRDKGYIETDSHITAMVPLVDWNDEVVAILCVQRQMDVLTTVRRQYLNTTICAMLALGLLVSIGMSVLLARSLLRPLKEISEEALRFSTENTVVRYNSISFLSTSRIAKEKRPGGRFPRRV